MNYKLKDNITLRKLKENNFKVHNGTIWYEIEYGIYLSFDFETLDYIGIEMFYLLETETAKEKERIGFEKLKKLCLVEVIE